MALSDPRAEGLDYGLGNDDIFGGRIDQIEVVGCDAFPQLSQLQHSSSQAGPGPADSLSVNGSSDRSPLFATTTAAIITPAEEDGFMTLLNNTCNNTTTNNFVTSMNFEVNDYSYNYSGKELQSSTFSPVIAPTSIIAATTGTLLSSQIFISGHFSRKNAKTSVQETHTTMIINMIYAYPRMMTRRETLPPLMHAYSWNVDTKDDENRLPVHLTNCMGVAQLFAVRSADTSAFVWATIRAEIRKFKKRLHTFNKYDALSAMQASLLYFIMRTLEYAPQDVKDDYAMLLIYKACFIISLN